MPLGQRAAVHLQGAGVEQENDAGVQDQKGQGIHRRRQPAGMQLDFCQQPVQPGETLSLVFLLHEGADHPHAGQVLPRRAGHAVKTFAHFFLQGHGSQNDAEDDDEQSQDHAAEDQGAAGVDRPGHDQRAENHEGGTQQQAQAEIDPRLHLVDIPRDPGDQRRGAEPVQIRIGERLDMGKKIMPQPGGKPDGRAGGKILGGDRGGQPEQSHQHQQQNALIHHGI